jgi:hypothetical protein
MYWSVGLFLDAPWSWAEETLGTFIPCGSVVVSCTGESSLKAKGAEIVDARLT